MEVQEQILDNQNVNTISSNKNNHVLLVIVTALLFLVMGIFLGYFLGKNNQLLSQKQIITENNKEISTIPTSMPNKKDACPSIGSGPIINGNTIENEITLEFCDRDTDKKYDVSVLLPSDMNVVRTNVSSFQNPPCMGCDLTAYELKDKKNELLLEIVIFNEAVGWPLPTNAVSIKKIDNVDEIVRYYENELKTPGYIYTTNKINPKAGEEDYRMSSGFVLKGTDEHAVFKIYFYYSGSENDKNAALQIADKIVSSLSLKSVTKSQEQK